MVDYGEAQRIVVEGKPTALEWFIVEHEPERSRDRQKFRQELQDVINEAVSGACVHGSQNFQIVESAKFPLSRSESATLWFCLGAVAASVVVCIVGMILKGMQ